MSERAPCRKRKPLDPSPHLARAAVARCRRPWRTTPAHGTLAFALALLLAACSGEETAAPPAGGPVVENTCPALGAPIDPATQTAMVFDLSGEAITGGASFFDLPMPCDMRLDENGKADLGNFPNPAGNTEVQQIIEAAHRHMEGWTTATQVYLRMTGPVDAAALPADPAAYRSPDAPIQLVDVDPDSSERGRRFPLEVGFNEHDETFRPANLLQVLPVQGFELRENNTYAVIVTRDLPTVPTREATADPNLCAALSGRPPEGVLATEALDAYAPLAAQLALEGVDPGTVVAATVFTTGEPTSRMYDITERVARWSPPAPTPPGPELTEVFDDYCVYEGAWEVPGLQAGSPPYLGLSDGGVIELDAAGEPVVQYTRTAPFVATVPRQPMPEAGYPLLFYIHGTGGVSTQVYERGPMDAEGNVPPGRGPSYLAAQRGWGSASMGGHLSQEHMGLLSLGGYVPYNFFNLQAMRDNFIQMTAEQILFRRLLTEMAWDVSACPGTDTSAAPDGLARFDPDMQVVTGQSLGGYLTALVAATDPSAWQGAVPTGAGGSWTEFALGPQDPPLTAMLELVLGMPAGEALDRWHPIIHLATLTIAGANNIHFLPAILKTPRNGRTAPHVLLVEGHVDLQVTIGLQRAFVAALGADMAGPDVTEIPPDIPVGPEGQIIQRIELAGGRQLPLPVSANVHVPGQGHRTAAVVRYAEDGIREGHYVAFQREEAKHQIGCFLEDLAAGRSPVVIEGEREGGACDAGPVR